MIDLFSVAAELQEFFLSRQWRFCFIGGVALQAWGEPRVTQDLDVSLFTGFKHEEDFVDLLLAKYEARISEPRDFALTRRVLLLKSPTNIGIDVALAGLPFEAGVIERAVDYDFLDGIRLRICSADDLVVLKAFAGRGKDWVDIDGIAARQSGNLNVAQILARLQPLAELKEDTNIIVELSRRLRQ
jgi:hypothetical protein